MFRSTILKSILVTVLLVAIAGCSSNSSTQSNSKTVDFADAPITESTVMDELSNVNDSGYKIKLDKITSVRIIEQTGTDTPNDMAINVAFTYNAWDDTDIVETAAGSSLELFRRLFRNKDVVRVVAQAQLPQMAGDGQDAGTETVVRFTLDRTTADQFDWAELKQDVLLDHNVLFKKVDAYHIDPSLEEFISK